jgi:hypothetical protein
MHLLAKNKSKNAADSAAPLNASGKLWQHLRRRLDRSTASNNDIRRVCHGLKTVITGKRSQLKTSKSAKADISQGRPEQASVERRESPKKTGLLQPLKKAWRKATGKSAGENSRKDQDRHQFSASHVATSDEDGAANFSNASSFSMVSEYARLIESSHTRPRLRALPQLPQVEISATVLSRSTTRASAPAQRNHTSEALERSPTSITYDTVSHQQSTYQHLSLRSSDLGEYESAINDKTPFQTARQYPRKRHGAKTLPQRRRKHRSTTSTRILTLSPSEGILTANRTEYDRIMNAVYRPAPSRIPIPVFWQITTPRAYNFRGPSSPYQNVTTVPLSNQKKRIDSASAMEPLLPTPPWSSLSPRQNTTPILRDIATRPAVKFSLPKYSESGDASLQGTWLRHGDSSTLDRRTKERSYTRLQRQKTLPRDWRLKNEANESMPPIATASCDPSGSNRSRFLPPVTLNDDGKGEDVWCDEGSEHTDRMSVKTCDSASTSDESQWQICVSDADEDVWVGEASRSDVAVVDVPLH